MRGLPLRAAALCGEPRLPQRGRRGDPAVPVEAEAAALQGAGGSAAAAAPGEAGELGQEPAAGGPLSHLRAGGGLQVCHQDRHLPAESLPCGHRDAGNACAPGSLPQFFCAHKAAFFSACGPKVHKGTNDNNWCKRFRTLHLIG